MSVIQQAHEAVDRPEVQAMIRELGKFGLGVFVPHLHTDKGFEPLPIDTVQLESSLQVTFVKKSDPILSNAAVVGWVWDEGKARVAAACACSGNHFPGNCSYSSERDR